MKKFLPHDQQAIVAQCTPQGPGALALVRIVGMNAIVVVDAIACLASKKKLIEVSSHTIHYGTVVSGDGSVIDTVLFLLMKAPQTFTGQDTVEITCHNNQFIIEAIIHAAIVAGARIADPGEFSKRAVMEGKIDLVQAEAINELIHANTQAGLKKAMAQLDGSLSEVIVQIEEQLLKALVFCESSFEFIEEEGLEFSDTIRSCLQVATHNIMSLQKTEPYQQHIRHGVKIALIGSVNAGKSSLFNALLGKNRAIVSAIAGTTRDTIEGGIYKDGIYWTLIDTAGIRKTADVLEQEGIDRSFAQAAQADIIVLVYDGSRAYNADELAIYNSFVAQYQNKIISVRTKADMQQEFSENNMALHAVSICDLDSIVTLHAIIARKVKELFENADVPFLLNARHYHLLSTVSQILAQVYELFEKKPIAYELIAYHLNDALAHLAHMSGKTVGEKVMDTVFQTFCVGK